MKKIISSACFLITLLCLILTAAFATFKLTGLQFCTVEGHSMDNTLFSSERILINPSARPGFGDIVVFEYEGTYLIKRVIGLPGDTVIVADGALYVNNVKYEEDYLSPECVTAFEKNSFAVTAGENEYFVMGDNRDDSHDSRSFGCIPKDSILGVAIWHF